MNSLDPPFLKGGSKHILIEIIPWYCFVALMYLNDWASCILDKLLSSDSDSRSDVWAQNNLKKKLFKTKT